MAVFLRNIEKNSHIEPPICGWLFLLMPRLNVKTRDRGNRKRRRSICGDFRNDFSVNREVKDRGPWDLGKI